MLPAWRVHRGGPVLGAGRASCCWQSGAYEAGGDAGSWHRQGPAPGTAPLCLVHLCVPVALTPSLSCPQLYELDEDPKRKEFLDDLFGFMQKRGKGGWLGWETLAPLPQLPGGAHSMVHSGTELLRVSTSPPGRSYRASPLHLLHTRM